nr:hypothetical protein [Nocardia brasiliensis]
MASERHERIPGSAKGAAPCVPTKPVFPLEHDCGPPSAPRSSTVTAAPARRR